MTGLLPGILLFLALAVVAGILYAVISRVERGNRWW